MGETLDRGELWRAQTPQVFRTDALRGALAVDAATRDAATDEAMLVERAGGVVLIHPCEGENLKVTTPSDLRLAETLLRRAPGTQRGRAFPRYARLMSTAVAGAAAAVAEQEPDEDGDEGELADAEGGAEVHRSQGQRQEGAAGEGGGEDQQLADHARSSLGAVA